VKSPPKTILVIVTRRIGDVLLATPFIRSLKVAWPQATIDVLVFRGTEGVLAGNPDINHVHTVPARPAFLYHFLFILKIVRRYDIAASVVPGDRPTLYAYFAGHYRVGLLLLTRKERWKKMLLHKWVAFDSLNTHTVRMNLALGKALGITARGEIRATWYAEHAKQVDQLLGSGRTRPFVVLHPYPKFNYKVWRRDGWAEVAHWITSRGYRVVLSGGSDSEELAYLGKVVRDMPAGTLNTAGTLSIGASACMVSRAAAFVGTDTALTHVAAALGVPTIALFGPSNPVKWGPWPRNHPPESDPWHRYGSQHVGNVTLLQGVASCVPCGLEGCDRDVSSYSDCLLQLSPKKVIAALEASTVISARA
jgi:heptosyltransferase III